MKYAKVDRSNRHLVGGNGAGEIIVQRPPTAPLTKDEALVFAAYLVSIADPDGRRFAIILEGVQEL